VKEPVMSQLRLFVSHSQFDNVFCRGLVQALEDADAEVWYDHQNMGPGELDFVIAREIASRPVFVVVLSPSALQSHWVKKECRLAIARYRQDPNRVILPVLAASLPTSMVWDFIGDFKCIQAPDRRPHDKRDTIPALRHTEAIRDTLYMLGLTPKGSVPGTFMLPGTLLPTSEHEQDDDIRTYSRVNADIAITLKHEDAYVAANARGDLSEHDTGTGFFWRGMRFLSTCEFFLGGLPLVPLSHSIRDEDRTCQVDLCNALILDAADTEVPVGALQVRRTLALQGQRLECRLRFVNFFGAQVTTSLGLKLETDFRDALELQGWRRPVRGAFQPPESTDQQLRFTYTGRDELRRETLVSLNPAVSHVVHDGVFWDLVLLPDEPVEVVISVALDEQVDRPTSSSRIAPSEARGTAAFEHGSRDFEQALERQGQEGEQGHKQEVDLLPRRDALPLVDSNNVFFNRLLWRGIYDLGMMCTRTTDGLYPYGGIPWHVCPFGRDALVTSIEFLPWFPQVARGTLAFLAAHQGIKVDEFTEEEPGRILHEYRRGEMANCREIPFIPSYGSVDATPLFLITLDQYIRWTNDLEFLRRLWPNAEAAAQWMLSYGDRDGDGFLEYALMSGKGRVQQGWKSSWDAVMHVDGTPAKPPIALCEVQGYAYAAYQAVSYLAGRLGRHEVSKAWRTVAEHLQARFLDGFWWPEEHACYLALDGEKRPCKVLSSNAGQVLWTGILPREWAQGVVDRLMQDDMYTGWGIRTLSSRAARYNPMSYHNGSVWPHDTALVGAGFARYGHKDLAGQLLGNLFGVGLYYAGSRLPELFCGFAHVEGYGPTRYPVACAPQSWAAGAPFLLLGAVLGFEPEADHQRLTLHNPTLPQWLQHLDLVDIRLGHQRLARHFVRSESGTGVTPIGDSTIEVLVVRE
jgi:glycogen debranching enzyme